MGGVTDWVRRALTELGAEAPDAEVKSYIRGKAPTVPESQVALALRKLRGKVIPARSKQPPQKPDDTPA